MTADQARRTYSTCFHKVKSADHVRAWEIDLAMCIVCVLQRKWGQGSYFATYHCVKLHLQHYKIKTKSNNRSVGLPLFRPIHKVRFPQRQAAKEYPRLQIIVPLSKLSRISTVYLS